jgi:3-oxoacyl-[acyl-carrier protein] reductase
MLKGKIALVTGGSRGIGKAVAELFALNGAKVIINGRDRDSLEKAREDIYSSCGGEAISVPFDVSKPEDVRDGFREIFKLTKSLDVLVNNAGVMSDALIGMVTTSMLEEVFCTNVFGTVYCCQYASRMMMRQKSGAIVNMGSIMGINGSEGLTVYSGSKAAVVGITRSLAKELAAYNIRVNAVAPGFIDTNMTVSLPSQKYQERVQSIKMKKAGNPNDVAGCVLYLASDLSSYVTGQIIGVDGGMII